MRAWLGLTLALALSTPACSGIYAPRSSGSGGSGGSTAGGGSVSGSVSGSAKGQYYDDPGAAYDSLPSRCRPSRAAWAEVQVMYDDTDGSVHELVTCGGMQVQAAQTFVPAIVASNRSMFDESSYEELTSLARDFGIQLDIDFERRENGEWFMPIGDDGSSFVVQFYDPETGELIEDNPFVIDSYLIGASASSSMTMDEMMGAPFQRNRFTWRFDDTASLSGLMNWGRPIDNPFEVRLSLADLAQYTWGIDIAFGDPDLGPFESLKDVRMRSRVLFSDDRGGTIVDYDVDGTDRSVDGVASSGVGFDVRTIVSARGDFELLGSGGDLEYVTRGSLAGTIEYRVTGPDIDLIVESDFGSGQAYPNARWRCAD